VDASPAVFKTAEGRSQRSEQVHICPLTSATSVVDSQWQPSRTPSNSSPAKPRHPSADHLPRFSESFAGVASRASSLLWSSRRLIWALLGCDRPDGHSSRKRLTIRSRVGR